MTAPFSSQGDAAVCARVAIAILRLMCKDKELRQVKPSILIGVAVKRLEGLRFATLRSCFMSLNVSLIEGRSSKAWLTGVIYRDMMGFTIRHCLSETYKATRRDPRVTNRGVKTTTSQHQSGETDHETATNTQGASDD